MKKRSKLFLIIAAGIFVLGLLLCSAAYIVSFSTGEVILAQKMSEGAKGYTYYFNDNDLDKIKLTVDDADINIIGGSETSYIELVNFNESMYSFAKNHATVTFNQKPDFSSIAGVWESGATFKGLRYFLFPGVGEGRKVINIYLDSNMTVRRFDLSANAGSIVIKDINTYTDYEIYTGSAMLTMERIVTEGAVSVSSDTSQTSKFIFDSLSAEAFNVTAPIADIKMNGVASRKCEISVSGGKAVVEFSPISEIGFTAAVSTKGRLLVNGESSIDSFSFSNLDKFTNTAPEDKEEKKEPAYIKINTDRAESDLAVELTIPEYAPKES